MQQYFKPAAHNEFFGDPMPFWANGRFHLFYLLDKNHHTENDGLGSHIWNHTSTADLVHWDEHPVAVPLGPPGSYDQHTICTGSAFEHAGVYYAFYATRIRDEQKNVSQHVCVSTSDDLIHFTKSPDNPILKAQVPGYAPRHFRDPCVFRDPMTGLFHMLVTACLWPEPALRQGGCLAHYVSPNLKNWEISEPFIVPGNMTAPECPDHFQWNDWWYLLYARGGVTEYRIARNPLGPWQRASRDTFEDFPFTVPKTAAFGNNRRIAVGFLPWWKDDKDDGARQYAGNAIFRELIQRPDGTLDTKFVPEMMPPSGSAVTLSLLPSSISATADGNGYALHSPTGISTARLAAVPVDAVIRLRIKPSANISDYGLILRADENASNGYGLRFFPSQRRMSLQRWKEGCYMGGHEFREFDVDTLDQPLTLTICMKDSIIDVCLNERRTMVGRCFEMRGNHLVLYARSGTAELVDLDVAPAV